MEQGKQKHFACGDIVAGCAFTVTGTDEEIMTQVAAHAASAHGIAPVTPDLAAQVKAAMKAR